MKEEEGVSKKVREKRKNQGGKEMEGRHHEDGGEEESGPWFHF